MKTWMVALISLALGVAMGYAFTWYEFWGVSEVFATGYESEKQADGHDAPAPKVRVTTGLEHDFGMMEAMTRRSHEFVIKNDGTAPLYLKADGKATCKCTQFVVRDETIAPGESGIVFLEWKPEKAESEFRQSATVRTNDPSRDVLTLTIRGIVVENARAVPGEIPFQSISANEERTAATRVLFYLSEGEKIESCVFLNRETAPLFHADWKPLADDELTSERLARSGLMLTVTVKPGLPIGAINQTIRLVFAGPEHKALEIPIKGVVSSEIALVGGSNFDRENLVLKLGLVKASQGLKTELRVLVKGPHRQDTKLHVASVDPESALQATLGDPTEISGGKVTVYLLTIEIPPGSPPVNRVGSEQNKSGRIVLDTTHPQVKQVLIKVAFAVED